MEDSINNVEDQPLPEPTMEEAQAAFQMSVNEFSQVLVHKLQLNGMQFNALELETRIFILVEQVNLLTKIIQQITNNSPAFSDLKLTESMTRQMGALSKAMSDELAKAPRIALDGADGPPTRL